MQVLSIINQGFGKAMKKDEKKSMVDVITEIYSRHAQHQSMQFDLKL